MSEYREELISPEGRTVTSTSAIETNNLIFGSGYRKADETTSDDDDADDDDADDDGPAESEPAESARPEQRYASETEPSSPYATGGMVNP